LESEAIEVQVEDDARTPRWVKASAAIGGGLILLIIVMTLAGHGPGRHIPRGVGTAGVPQGAIQDQPPHEGGGP
jgi:hypothetical protein